MRGEEVKADELMVKGSEKGETEGDDKFIAVMNLQDILLADSPKPMITLLANGKHVAFLCDSGACRTTCKEWIPGAKPSAERITVRSANGQLTSVVQSQPVHIQDKQGKDCYIPILLYVQSIY